MGELVEARARDPADARDHRIGELPYRRRAGDLDGGPEQDVVVADRRLADESHPVIEAPRHPCPAISRVDGILYGCREVGRVMLQAGRGRS